MALIERLADGPLDLVGDVHGELDALHTLLGLLGYAEDGRHPQGRRLVFVGDLTDRGPDSPGVLSRVRAWVEQGSADCVLGNHELNLLRGARKDGNGWFFDDDHDRAAGRYWDCRRLDPMQRPALLEFLARVPLALERADLRVVHAAWQPAAIAAVRRLGEVDARAYDRQAQARLEAELKALAASAAVQREAAVYERYARDPARPPPRLPQLARVQERQQNGHPLRVLTSGPEQEAEAPFFSSGQWRLLERVRWWQAYTDPQPVVFGHYWRVPEGMPAPAHKAGLDLFAGYRDGDWLGPARRAFCVDFCAGLRAHERSRGQGEFQGRLAALRWPEGLLVMDDGRRIVTQPEGPV